MLLFTSPSQQKRKLRIYISNTYTPGKPEGEEAEKVSSWELRVEGKLLEDVSEPTVSVYLTPVVASLKLVTSPT